jgi:hypothetical protein
VRGFAGHANTVPDIVGRFGSPGPTPGSTPEKAAAFINTELAKWAPIIRASGAHID